MVKAKNSLTESKNVVSRVHQGGTFIWYGFSIQLQKKKKNCFQKLEKREQESREAGNDLPKPPPNAICPGRTANGRPVSARRVLRDKTAGLGSLVGGGLDGGELFRGCRPCHGTV